MPGVNVRIADAEGNTAQADSPGEIMIKSSGVMKGYYRQPDLTAETITDGWLRTGDIGKLDANGNLYMLGRTKDIIITGGENISPFEVEACLIEHLAIREAAVVGRRDQLLQEVPCAFLVKNDHPEKPTELDIMKFCKNRLSSHKVPRSVRFLAELPKLGTSKVDRNTLRKMAETLH
jgi:acyl-CoA synthetase (AMP-forming)/AMP-acid ligase II